MPLLPPSAAQDHYGDCCHGRWDGGMNLLLILQMYMYTSVCLSGCTLPGHVSPDKHVIVGLNDKAHIGKETTAHQVHILLHLLRTTQQLSKPHAISLTQNVNMVMQAHTIVAFSSPSAFPTGCIGRQNQQS